MFSKHQDGAKMAGGHLRGSWESWNPSAERQQSPPCVSTNPAGTYTLVSTSLERRLIDSHGSCYEAS